MKKFLYWSIGIVIALSVILLHTYSLLDGNGFFLKRADAVEINNVTYKAGEVDYYFSAVRNQYYNAAMEAYYSYGFDIYGINFSRSLFKQEYDQETGQSWGDMMLETALESLQSDVMLSSEAIKNGFELPESAKKDIETAIASLEESAKSQKISVKALIKQGYGKSATYDMFVKLTERSALAGAYSEYLYDEYGFTAEEITKRYDENKNDFDRVDFRSFNVTVELDAHTDEDGKTISNDETKEQDEKKVSERAEELRKKLAELDGEEAFNELAEELTRTEASDGTEKEGVSPEDTLNKGKTYAGLTEDAAKWLFDEAREAGDTNITTSSNTLTVYYFLSRSDNSFPSRTVRHILVRIDTDIEDEDEKEEENERAKTEAEKLLDEWKAGAATEDSFAELARDKTEDTASASDGGLIDGIGIGSYVDAFENWAMDGDRKPGDTGVVETDYGYHVMYYVGEGMLMRDKLVDDALRAEAHEEYLEGLKEAYPVTKINSGISKLK